MKKTQSELESRIVTGAHGVAAEEDHLSLSKVLAVGVGSIVLFVIGGIAAYFI
jgi:Sec-independent protein secretion pathway component TatC